MFQTITSGPPTGAVGSGSNILALDKAAGVVYVGGSNGYQVNMYSAQDAMTAFAGGGQASGTKIVAQISRFTTVATIADSGTLPVSIPGMSITVTNAAANSMNVFPATGEAINALAGNAAFAVAGTKTVEFVCAKAGQWHTLLTA